MANPSFFASGNVSPSRFVMISNPFRVQQAVANSKLIGVSQNGTRNPPGTASDDGFAAISGEPVQVFSAGDLCLIELGATVTAGARLASDANGKGVLATSGQNYGAILLDSGVSGDKVQCYVQLGTQSA